jgi:bifunctional non-homologous end joining protein LigD
VVFKRLKAAHSAGRPNSGGDQLKLKFYEMASVIVMALTKGKRSVEMGVVKAPAVHPKAALMPAKFQVDGVVPIGSVTIPANQEIPAVGSVCEVRYLYTYPTGSMFQTTYLRPRTDVDPEECHAAQLKFRVASEDDEG